MLSEELQKKVNIAIKLIQSASKIAQKNGQKEIAIGYSGGKDSDVILELTKMACVPYRAIHLVTTIDPAGTIKHAIDNGCEINKPKMSFLELIGKNGFPSRMRRFCCRILKERYVADYMIFGIRADESNKRKARYKEPEQCYVYSKKKKCRQYFPILNWTKDDVLEFIKECGIKLHPLYYRKDGRIDVTRRLGCMCCPLLSYKQRIQRFKDNPNMVKLYVRGGKHYLDNHPLSKMSKLCKDAYEFFCFDVFCECSNVRFQQMFGKNLFDNGTNCKEFLENYFKIKFN